MARVAHRLRGSVANFGAHSATGAAQRLEEMAIRGELGDADAVFAEMERSMAEVMVTLRELQG
jgi:HPt (histidine-containing phosphotransfer) domain-containing protein